MVLWVIVYSETKGAIASKLRSCWGGAAIPYCPSLALVVLRTSRNHGTECFVRQKSLHNVNDSANAVEIMNFP